MAYVDKELFKQDIKMRYCNNCARPNEIKCRACHIDDMLGEIEDAPTADVVEVVRCRDCKYCEVVTDQFDNDWYFCTNTKDNAEVKPDAFCSYGERRTDND